MQICKNQEVRKIFMFLTVMKSNKFLFCFWISKKPELLENFETDVIGHSPQENCVSIEKLKISF